MMSILRRLFPAYFSDYWMREREFSPFRAAISAAFVTGGAGAQPFDNRSALASMTTPSLVIVGADDFICGLRWANELHAGIRESQLLLLDRSGHFGHIEQAADFADAVAAFVSQGS